MGLHVDGALFWLDFNGGLQRAHIFFSATLETIIFHGNRFPNCYMRANIRAELNGAFL